MGFARAAAKGNYGSSTWVNVFYFQPDPAEGATATEVATDVAEAVALLYSSIGLHQFNGAWVHSRTTVLWAFETGSVKRLTVADAAPGEDDSDGEAAQVSYLINWDADDPRKGGKPRNYISGVTEDNMADSASLTTDAQTTLNEGIATWLAALPVTSNFANGTSFTFGEMSFVDAGVDRDVPVFYEINTGSVNPVVATQRRRVDRLRTS